MKSEFQPKIEIIAGLFVLGGLLAFAYLAIVIAGNKIQFEDTYVLNARFKNVGGLNTGSAVTISGVQVGTVNKIALDSDSFDAIVSFQLPVSLELPDDTIAGIKTNGLIGDKYLNLLPGGSLLMLQPDDTIIDTESAVSIEDLISRFAFGEIE